MRVVHLGRSSHFVIAAITLCAVEIAIVNSLYWHYSGQLPDLASLAVTTDLVVGIPVLYYLLVVRRNKFPIIALLPVLLSAGLITSLILPPTSQLYLEWVKYAVPDLLLLLMAAEVLESFRTMRRDSIYAMDALELSLRKLFGSTPLTLYVATELSAWYYVLAGWFVRWSSPLPGLIPFSYHKKTLYPMLLTALSFVALVESVALHLIIQHWNVTAAWIVSALNVYTMIWVFADFNAIRLNPIVLDSHTLHIRQGLRWRGSVSLLDISEVRPIKHADKEQTGYISLALSTDARLVVSLTKSIILTGFLGRQKQVSSIGLALDDEKLFVAEIAKRMADRAPIETAEG